MQYLVDTGIWLRLFDRSDPQHANIRDALRSLCATGHTLAICPQNIAEFWNVSTRPASARGGYGKSIATTELRAKFIERNASILSDSPATYSEWRKLLVTHQIQGVAVHDARLVAVMIWTGVSHVLTLNVADFARYVEITATTPNEVISSVKP